MFAIYKKELKSYFNNMTGYVFIAFMLIASGIFMAAYNILSGSPYFEQVLTAMDFIFLAMIPLITMNSFSLERRNKTDQLLLTSPVKVSEIVTGKYLSMLTMLFIPIAVMGTYPLILSAFGDINFGTAYSTLLAFFLLGGSLISIGMFISSVTESSVISAIASIGSFLVIYLMNAIAGMIPETSRVSFLIIIAVIIIIGIIIQVVTKNTPIAVISLVVLAGAALAVFLISPDLYTGLVPNILGELDLFYSLNIFADGKLDLTVIAYYLSVIFLFGFLTVRSIDKRRWN